MADDSLTSPEGIMMLSLGILLDFIGYVILILGIWFAIDDYGLIELFAAITLGFWVLMRNSEGLPSIKEVTKYAKDVSSKAKSAGPKSGEAGGSAKSSKEGGDAGGGDPIGDVASLGTGILKRFGWTLLYKLCPFLGNIWPAYTIFIYKELNNTPNPTAPEEGAPETGAGKKENPASAPSADSEKQGPAQGAPQNISSSNAPNKKPQSPAGK